MQIWGISQQLFLVNTIIFRQGVQVYQEVKINRIVIPCGLNLNLVYQLTKVGRVYADIVCQIAVGYQVQNMRTSL